MTFESIEETVIKNIEPARELLLFNVGQNSSITDMYVNKRYVSYFATFFP